MLLDQMGSAETIFVIVSIQHYRSLPSYDDFQKPENVKIIEVFVLQAWGYLVPTAS